MMHQFNPDRWAVQAAVRAIIEHPFHHDWSVQGFGMLRTYLDEEHAYRLNIWDSELAVENVSLIHDHPWSFRSWICAGVMDNVTYKEGEGDQFGETLWYEWGLLVPGPRGGHMTAGSPVRMHEADLHQYRRGDTYDQTCDVVHKTVFTDGTVSLNWRHGRASQDLARVFWPAGEKWVDAKPRIATEAEIVGACAKALTAFQNGE